MNEKMTTIETVDIKSLDAGMNTASAEAAKTDAVQAPLQKWSKAEKILVPVSLLIAVLFDRLVMAVFTSDMIAEHMRVFYAMFWLCYLVIFCGMFWRRIKHDRVLWLVSVCTVALCVWNFFHSAGNFQFAALTALVIPGVLMAHAQWTTHTFTLKNCGGMVMEWFIGWVITPFSGLPSLAGVVSALPSAHNKPVIKRVLLGVSIAAALMLVIIPLLMGADQVFSYYLTQMFTSFSFGRLIFHGLVILLAFGLFYSFLWNVGFGGRKPIVLAGDMSIDVIISSIVLGSVILVYVLFCVIQFTYLFAEAGLPAGMTFSEYAREGFAQTLVVCALNLFIFGVFLRYGINVQRRNRWVKGLLCALLVLTCIMLFSGWVRLELYIWAFGMTWLRLLSAWFILYLAVVIGLCGVRLLFKRDFPVLAVSALVLLVWWVVLGYLNPDGFIDWYNYDFFLR